jgi:hypothetical protein
MNESERLLTRHDNDRHGQGIGSGEVVLRQEDEVFAAISCGIRHGQHNVVVDSVVDNQSVLGVMGAIESIASHT